MSDHSVSNLMREKSQTRTGGAVFGWLAPAIGASACALLLWPASESCVARPLDTSGAAAIRATDHAGPPLERTIAKQRYGFANTRPVFDGSADAGGSIHDTLPTSRPEPALTGVWSPLQSSEVQRRRGRAPPSILLPGSR